MFIKNPNKKESYSFRVKPELLENIKNYAKATNQTVPEILNEMIEEKTKGLYLTNDYIDDTMATTNVIGLPPLEDIYNNGNYREFGLYFENNNRVLYEVKRIPNNLDIWTDNEGYTSDKRGVDHEGISFVLAPELITKTEYLKTPELLFCCLIPVYFRVSIKKKTIQAKNISFTDALAKIRDSPNMELLDEFTKCTNEVKEILNTYSSIANQGFTTPEHENKTYIRLMNDLQALTESINTNIVSHYNEAIERTNKHSIEFDSIEFGAGNISELMDENQALKDRVNELESTLNNIITKIENLENLNPKNWEELKETENNE